MLPSYNDIRSRISEDPSWFTGDGVPRYGHFEPEALGVYDVIAALFLVRCQSCQAQLKIGAGRPRLTLWQVMRDKEPKVATLEEFARSWQCGDPPRHDCPGAGETMTAIEVAVLEAWERLGLKWERRVDLEGAILPIT